MVAKTEELYPAGPASVPADLTRPSGAYRRHAYLAVAGLFVFLLLYFALAGWFAWTSYRLLSNVSRAPNPVFQVIGGVCAGFLAIFMFKALVFMRRGARTGDIELSPAQHPELFAFLYRLADEARAPRPHRVYLSPQVNAAVFFDLSIANLILPSRKNLEVGLGLINVLTLGELKAVLAHEFGHFAQRTMAVGRWVYIAQQIAGHIVVRRDGLDRFLQWLSAIDLRIAWLGWVLRLIVWSIRSLVDTVFGWVILAQRALSREMELQADLVAVSLTGSDALVHALHRLDAADDAMDRAIAFASAERQGGRAVADLFAVQTRMLARKREILGDPGHGAVPALPAAPEGHRLFKAKLAHPPRMWATHPPNEVREENAKRVYVAAPLDDRKGWVLFRHPQRVREQVTASLYKGDGPAPATVPMEATLATFDARFDRRYFDPAYRGAYLGRSVVRDAQKPAELYGEPPQPEQVVAALEGLYPPSLSTDLEQARELGEEKVMIEALQRGILEMPGGIVRCRGREVRRRELPALQAEIQKALVAVQKRVREHDRRVRTVHLGAARALTRSLEWEAYLRGLGALLHYAEHREADLEDAVGSLENVFAVVTADRRVTASEIDRLVGEASALHGVLEDIHDQASKIELTPAVAAHLGQDSWAATLGALQLPPPSAAIIGEWMEAAHSWAAGTGGALAALGSATLDELLQAEEVVALHARSGREAPEAPPAPKVPPRYGVLLPGEERPRQTKLGWWDRFQVADGLVPSVARLAVAGGMVACVLWAGRSVGDAAPEREVTSYELPAGEDEPADDLASEAELRRVDSAVAYLDRGDLAAAVGAVQGSVAEETVVVFAAASDGASPYLVSRALAVSPERILGPSALYAAAVAIRAGRDPAPFLDRLAADPDVPAELVSFLEVLRTGDPREATDELEGLRVEDRPVAMAAAVIALGERCPPEWRRMATELLSTGQRPYFAR